MDRRAKLTKSGAAASSLPTCNYYEQMLFLVEGGVGNAQTESNIEYLVTETRNVSENGIEEPMTPNDNAEVVIATPATKKQKISNERIASEKEAFSSTPKAKKQKMPNQKIGNDVETEILKHIESVNDALKENPSEKDRDEVVLFCDGLVPQLRSLPTRKFRRLKLDIERLVFDTIYDE